MSDKDNKTLDGELRLRIGQDELDTFIAKSSVDTGKPYQSLIREIIVAFNESRLRILPTESQKKSLKSLGELYNVPRK